jgi:hypothetical protein
MIKELELNQKWQMALAVFRKITDKTPKPEKQRGEYDKKLQVKGSFLDIIKASVKDANAKVSKKKKGAIKP